MRSFDAVRSVAVFEAAKGLIALVAGGLGLISFYFFKDKYLLIISMAGRSAEVVVFASRRSTQSRPSLAL